MNKENFTNIGFLFFFIILSLSIAFRAEIVGTDAPRYSSQFLKAHLADLDFFIERIIKFELFELGFLLFMKVVSLLSSSKLSFFFCVAFVITYLQFLSYKKLKIGKNIYDDLFFVSVLLFSSWYITEVANGIKQGLSLSILYFAIFSYLKNSNYTKFLILFFFSTIFHYPQIILLPFLLLVKVRLKYVYIIWFLILLFYIIDLNEIIVKYLSVFFNLSLYDLIKNYGGDGGRWIGFQLDFVLYTAFFALLPIILSFSNLIKFKNNENLIFVLKVYLLLSMAYFTFGFGPFSNRFAIMCWFLIPILQSSLFSNINFNKISLILISFTLFIISIYFFFFIRLQYLSF